MLTPPGRGKANARTVGSHCCLSALLKLSVGSESRDWEWRVRGHVKKADFPFQESQIPRTVGGPNTGIFNTHSK